MRSRLGPSHPEPLVAVRNPLVPQEASDALRLPPTVVYRDREKMRR